MNTTPSHSLIKSLSLTGWLSIGLAAQQPAAVVAPAPAPAAQGSQDQVRRDAPAPAPVTAAEQSTLARPLHTETPPAVGDQVSTTLWPGGSPNMFPWTTGLSMSRLFPWLSPTPTMSDLGNGSNLVPMANGTIAFADYIGLLILPDQAGYTFASSPYYIQGVGSGWVHVKENDTARYGSAWGSNYAHYHLMYEAGPFCLPAGNNYGYQLNIFGQSICVPVQEPATMPRYLASHHGTQWIRIYVYKSGVPEMNFDFRSIRVRGTQGIKLYFRKADGNWLHWNNLGPGTWNTAPYCTGIREVLLRASNDSPNSYSIDDIAVTVN